jgi:hypothetical protein
MLLVMRSGCTIKTCGVVIVALLAGSLVQAGPLKNPKRMVAGHTVDLSPLFRWWSKHEGDRPLAAWVHVTGSVVGTNAWGWVVEAQVEKTSRPGSSHEGDVKLLLKNPPVQELAEFERLMAEMKALNEQRGNILAQETQAKDRADSVSREQAANRRNGVRNRGLAVEGRQLRWTDSQLKNQLKPYDQQLQDLKTKLAAYPNPDHYTLDCLALDAEQKYNGMPVFDHGLALP